MNLLIDKLSAELLEIACFLDEAFGIKNYMLLYPHIFLKEDFKNFFILRDEKGIIAFCVLYESVWKKGEECWRGGCIGSVAVRHDMRGQGLGRKIISLAEQEAIRRNYDFVYLFSDNIGFYQKLGFIPVGEDLLIPLDTEFSRLVEKKVFQKLNSANYQFVWKDTQEILEKDIKLMYEFILQTSFPCENCLYWDDFLLCMRYIPMKVFFLMHKYKGLCALGLWEKGVDAQKTLHGVWAKNDDVFLFLYHVFKFLQHHHQTGWWVASLWRTFLERSSVCKQPLFLAKILNEERIHWKMFENYQLYPRVLTSA